MCPSIVVTFLKQACNFYIIYDKSMYLYKYSDSSNNAHFMSITILIFFNIILMSVKHFILLHNVNFFQF